MKSCHGGEIDLATLPMVLPESSECSEKKENGAYHHQFKPRNACVLCCFSISI